MVWFGFFCPKRGLERGLQNTAMRSCGRHVAGLIEEPEPLPLFAECTQIFRRVDQLTGTDGRVGVVNRKKATDVSADKQCQHDADHEAGTVSYVALIRAIWAVEIEHESNPCWCYQSSRGIRLGVLQKESETKLSSARAAHQV